MNTTDTTTYAPCWGAAILRPHEHESVKAFRNAADRESFIAAVNSPDYCGAFVQGSARVLTAQEAAEIGAMPFNGVI